jgi:tryptophan synthase alpha chain
MSRIAQRFAQLTQAKRKALIPYITAGDPDLQTTEALLHALVESGCDILEIGVPFSDPMADGPAIQRAGERALKQHIGLVDILSMVQRFRLRDTATPIVLMGYANPIESMGQKQFAERAQLAGIDGLLTVDYPPEEIGEFVQMLEQHHIAPIFLLAPTSTEARIRAVGKIARGYVYYVSLNGVTGAGNLDTADVATRLQSIRQHVSLPVGVGFGISDAQSAQKISLVADAVVIGSKLIDTMTKACAGLPTAQQSQAAIDAGATWLAGIRQALNVARLPAGASAGAGAAGAHAGGNQA